MGSNELRWEKATDLLSLSYTMTGWPDPDDRVLMAEVGHTEISRLG